MSVDDLIQNGGLTPTHVWVSTQNNGYLSYQNIKLWILFHLSYTFIKECYLIRLANKKPLIQYAQPFNTDNDIFDNSKSIPLAHSSHYSALCLIYIHVLGRHFDLGDWISFLSAVFVFSCYYFYNNVSHDRVTFIVIGLPSSNSYERIGVKPQII